MANPEVVPNPGLRVRKKRELRRRILRAAMTRFSDRGFSETRVEEIASDLNISAATIFNYFGSKDAVLLEIAMEMLTQFETVLGEIVDSDDPDLIDSANLVRRVASRFEGTPTINRRFYLELMRVTLPHAAGSEFAARTQIVLERLMRDGQSRGAIRADRPAEQLAQRVADMLTGAFNNWLNDPGKPLAERLTAAVNFMQDALRPPA